ncbi:FtsQ-type POTRA domain-containing protein, partial [Leucobacter soli]
RARRSVRDRERRERRRFTAHLRRRRVNWLVAGGAVAALAVFVAVGVLSPLTAVREIRVVGASKIDPDALQPALERFTGVPLALVGDGEVHRALEPFPLIQRYSIERIPPHTLLIRIEERDAVIAVKRGDRFELRDPAGVLVDRTDGRPKGVPLASGRVKDPSTPAFAAAARIVRDLPDDIRRKLVGVSASSAQDVTFELTGGRSVVWGEPAETQRKAVVLRAMLKSVKSASRIDVSSPDTPVFT